MMFITSKRDETFAFLSSSEGTFSKRVGKKKTIPYILFHSSTPTKGAFRKRTEVYSVRTGLMMFIVSNRDETFAFLSSS